ncbi:MAG: hypothetical protein M3401_09095 [Actinomycetota bacterium]|nr:hypothetical protein [Actinomycetota bacterium]
MPGTILEALTRRRLGGAVLVLAGVVVAAVVLWPDGGGRTAPQPVRLVSVPQLGLALAHPSTWKQRIDGRVLRLRGPDGSAVLTFSAPLAGRNPRGVKAAMERALLKRLAPAEIVRDGPGRLGARRVTSFELVGFAADYKRVRALVLIDSTPYRTYAVTLLTAGRPSRRRLAEVQQILATVRLTKPVRRSKK